MINVSGRYVNVDTECLIEWVLDGQPTKSADQYDSFSRRIRISWSRPDHENAPKGKEREELYFIHAPPPNADTNSVLEEKTDSLAQDYKFYNGNIYERISRWITRCDHNHQKPYDQLDDRDRDSIHELAKQTWFNVVDVQDMKLTKLPVSDAGPEPYVALSYRWGSNSHETRLSNSVRRKQDGGLNMDDMPRTIQDAIQLVRELALKRGGHDVRFIWIDSLCIEQDNSMSWRCNAESMHLVFGNAHFTICAADGDSGTGLRAINPQSRSPSKEREIKEDLRLLVSSSPESIIQTSDWGKRGWTFQERILSRRCLIFAGGRIYLQCRTSNYDDTGIGWSSDWRKSPLRTVAEVKDRPIQFYMKCVESYTGRDLTLPEDILKAFSGVSRLIEWYTCAPFFFGLPSSHFDFALLWRPQEGKVRRPGNPDKDAVFPSWSWSGWQLEGNPGTGTTAYYPLDILEGALIHLHHWLLKHTWIVWYIRDGDGHLRPLWHGNFPKYPERAQKMLDRWKGYKDKEAEGEVDAYDRRLRWSHRGLPRTNFIRTLPDYPSAVLADPPLPPDPIKLTYLPILQFFAWKCNFYIARNYNAPSPGEELARLDVLNQHRDWCGTVVLDKSWATEHDNKLCQFIALSDARKFTEYECTSWTHPIPKNLEDVDWHLYHVMLIEEFPDRLVWERKGLGKVLKVAFEPLEPEKWAEITLA